MNVLERDYFTDLEVIRDPNPYYAALHERGPVVREPHHGVFMVSGLEEVLETLNRDQRLDVWAKLLFFLQARRSSEDRRPLDLLRDGRVREAVLAAQAYAE